MAAPEEVLRTYLLALNFKIDSTQTKKFENTLVGIGVKANLLSDVIKKVAGSILDMAEDIVRSSDKLFLSARHFGVPAQALAAMAFSGKQAGVEVTGAIAAINRALQANGPAKIFIESLLRRPLTSKDNAVNLVDPILDAINAEKDNYTKIWDAQMVGIPQDLLFDLLKSRANRKQAEDFYNEAAKAAGVDLDKLGDSSHKLMNAIGEFGAVIDLLTKSAFSKMLPVIDSLVEWFTPHNMMARFKEMMGVNEVKPGDLLGAAVPSKEGVTAGGALAQAIYKQAYEWIRYKLVSAGHPAGWAEAHGVHAPTLSAGGGSAGDDSVGGPGWAGTGYSRSQIQEFIATMEKEHHLFPGILSAIAKVESNWGQDPGTNVKHDGVVGFMQINTANANSHHMTDRLDALENIRVAAEMMEMNARGHSWDQALNMYANGTDKVGTGADPAYVDKIHRAQLSQTNVITINAPDASAHAIGGAVKGALGSANDEWRNQYPGAQ